ncbi:Ion channel [Dictyocaulus viviparus]|uniref:Ion channel n=1 Tax=Dictyocaulus viviparus TaxID=29172 RepID=A0A0D8XUN5_DICVI|nr:Ion channel [Dictyocaulus viviparus]
MERESHDVVDDFLSRNTQRKKSSGLWNENHTKSVDDDASSDGESELDADEDTTTEGIVLFFAFVLYIIVGSIVIAAYEPNMNFFEAIYFNFVTLTTIGLGDLVPQSDTYLVITLIYCAVGLALTTIAIEIAADTLKKIHYFGRKVENVANVQVWFGGKKFVNQFKHLSINKNKSIKSKFKYGYYKVFNPVIFDHSSFKFIS